jgi:hypothetical protein
VLSDVLACLLKCVENGRHQRVHGGDRPAEPGLRRDIHDLNVTFRRAVNCGDFCGDSAFRSLAQRYLCGVVVLMKTPIFHHDEHALEILRNTASSPQPDFKSFASADFATRAGRLSGLTHYTIGVWQQPVRRCLMRVRIPAEQ